MNLVYLSFCVALIPPTKFRFNPSLIFEEDNVTLFMNSRWVRWRNGAEWNDHCNSESQCGLYAYHKVLNVTYGSGVDVIFTSSGWLAWRSDILRIRTTCAIL